MKTLALAVLVLAAVPSFAAPAGDVDPLADGYSSLHAAAVKAAVDGSGTLAVLTLVHFDLEAKRDQLAAELLAPQARAEYGIKTLRADFAGNARIKPDISTMSDEEVVSYVLEFEATPYDLRKSLCPFHVVDSAAAVMADAQADLIRTAASMIEPKRKLADVERRLAEVDAQIAKLSKRGAR